MFPRWSRTMNRSRSADIHLLECKNERVQDSGRKQSGFTFPNHEELEFRSTGPDRRRHTVAITEKYPSIVQGLALLLAAMCPGIIVWRILPPMYSDYTLLPFISNPAQAMPHYPPLYPYLVWFIHAAANRLCGNSAGASQCGITSLVLFQQSALALSLLYFAYGCSRFFRGRLLALIPIYAAPALLLSNEGLRTDALLVPCCVLIAGACLRLVRPTGSKVHLLLFLIAITIGMSVKPPVLFISVAAPLASLLAFIFTRDVHRLRTAAYACSAILLAIGLSFGITRIAMSLHGMPPAVAWNRSVTEVIQRIVWEHEEGARSGNISAYRASLIPPLQAVAKNDPVLRAAIPTILRYLDSTYDGKGKAMTWGGAHYALIRGGIAPDMNTADRIMSRFCIAFMEAFPGELAGHIVRTVVQNIKDITLVPGPDARALIVAGATGDERKLQDLAEATIQSPHRFNPAFVEFAMRILSLRAADIGLLSQFSPAITPVDSGMLSAHFKLLKNPLFRSWLEIPDAFFWVGLALSLLILLLFQPLPLGELCTIVGCVAGIVLYVVCDAALQADIPRYHLPYEALLYLAFGVALATVVSPEPCQESDVRILARG